MKRRAGITLFCVSVFALGSQTPAMGAAPAAPAAAEQYCYTEVAPASPGSRELVPVSTTCSDTNIPGTVMPDAAQAPNEGTLLVTFFESADYLGRFTTIGGQFGTCDAQGYGLSDLRYANAIIGGISSYKLNGGCRRAQYWKDINYTGQTRSVTGQNCNYVLGNWNDSLFSMRVRS